MDSFVGEIRILPYVFAPEDWSWCNGQQVAIQQNQALFAVIGTNFGGDGRNYFNLPNLGIANGTPGFAVMGTGTGNGLTLRHIGDRTGEQTVQLASINQFPAHQHGVRTVIDSSAAEFKANPTSSYIARGYQSQLDAGFYTFAVPDPSKVVAFRSDAIDANGLSPAISHDNTQPYLTMNFCISLAGEFPMRP